MGISRLPKTFAEFLRTLKNGQSWQELSKSYLNLVRVIQPLNAFTSVTQEPRLEDETKSALHGIPFAVKDNFCTKDFPTTCGSAMLENFNPPFDATMVEKSREAGAWIVGKTNLDEFAMGSGGLDSIFGPTKSVWKSGLPYELVDLEGNLISETDSSENLNTDKWIVAGGSSSGSAVAVSSGSCLAALGSDTGGSTRIPGAWNGIPTLKPTYGALSRHGLIPLCNSLDVPGLMANCVEDLATMFNLLKGCDPKDSTTIDESFNGFDDFNVSRLTVGIPEEYFCSGMSEETVQVWSEVADLLENCGAKVKKVSLVHTPYSIVCYSALNPCEVASNMARYDGLEYGLRSENKISTNAMFADSRHRGFNSVVRERILVGNYFLLKENQEDYFEQALKIRRLVFEDFVRVWQQEVDLLLTPVTLSVAPTYKEFSNLDSRTQCSRQDYCTQPANLAGLPAATVPIRLSEKEGLPLSLQIIGQRCQDVRVLKLCSWIEEKVKFPILRLKV